MNFETKNSLEVLDRTAAMGFNTVELFIFGVMHIAFDSQKDGAFLKQLVDRARANGLRTTLYLGVHVFHSLNHPLGPRTKEWAQRDATGACYKNYGTYDCICVNSGWRDQFFSVVEALAAYDIDGLDLDGPMIIPGGCFCDTCRKLFLEQHGDDLGKADPKEVTRFNMGTLDRFLTEAYARFKRLKPDASFSINSPHSMFEAAHFSFPGILAYNDYWLTENGFKFYGPPRQAATCWTSSVMKLFEALAPGKPRVGAMASDQKPWSKYIHTATETKLTLASTLANGGGIWYGQVEPVDPVGSRSARAAGEILRVVAKHEACFYGAESCATAAVMYSLDTERIYKTSTVTSDLYGKGGGGGQFYGNFRNALNGTCDLLTRAGIPFDFVTDVNVAPDRLARYQCILLPACACLSDQAVSSLRAYVKNGGNIIAAFDTALYTPEGTSRGDFGLGDVLGVSWLGGITEYKNWNYFTPCIEHAWFKGVENTFLPAPPLGLDVKPLTGAEVLARFYPPVPGRYVLDFEKPDKPALVLNTCGKGRCLYLAGTFAEMFNAYNPDEYMTIVANAVRTFSQPPAELRGDWANIELVVRKQNSRRIIHLVNYGAPAPRPYTRVFPQPNVRLVLGGVRSKPARVTALFAGRDCAHRIEGSELVIDLPPLGEYEVIVVDC